MAQVGYKRWQVAGLALTAGAVAFGIGAVVYWYFPDTETAIVGTWGGSPADESPGRITFRPDGRYEYLPVPGGPAPEAGRYTVSPGGTSVRFIPDDGPERRIRVEFAGRNLFFAVDRLPTGETTGVPFHRK